MINTGVFGSSSLAGFFLTKKASPSYDEEVEDWAGRKVQGKIASRSRPSSEWSREESPSFQGIFP